jgi:hypothetical protein
MDNDDEADFFDFTKPLFQDPPDDIEEDWSGFLIGGMAQTDELALVRSYKMAADAVVAKALKSADLSYEFAYPALYLYRHVIELYLKLIVQPAKPSHAIIKLARQFKAIVQSKLKMKIPAWVMDRFREFAEIDPDSQSFRYTKDRQGDQIWLPGETWVSFRHLRKTMDVLASGFEKAYFALPSRKGRK